MNIFLIAFHYTIFDTGWEDAEHFTLTMCIERTGGCYYLFVMKSLCINRALRSF